MRRTALPRDQLATPRAPIRAVRETLSDIAASGMTSAAIRNAPTPSSAAPCEPRMRSSWSQKESYAVANVRGADSTIAAISSASSGDEHEQVRRHHDPHPRLELGDAAARAGARARASGRSA